MAHTKKVHLNENAKILFSNTTTDNQSLKRDGSVVEGYSAFPTTAGTFTSTDGKTITVANGIITSIV